MKIDLKINTDSNYKTLDILRICLSILVVAIHTMPFSSFNRTINALFVNEICRVAVPVFFLINGYFFFKSELTILKLKRFIFSLLISYLSFSCVYLFVNLWFQNGILSRYIIITLKEGYGHLWYVHSLIIGILISYFLFRYIHSEKVLGLIALVIYLFGAIANDFVGIAKGVFGFIRLAMIRHTFFMAVPFIILGGVISKCKFKKNIWILLFGCILLSLENLILFKFKISQGYEDNFFMIFVACSLFVTAINTKLPVRYERFYSLVGGNNIRKCGNIIYYIHGVYVAIFAEYISNSFIYFFVVLLASFVSVIVWNMLKRKFLAKVK